MNKKLPIYRFPIMLLAVITLITAAWAGLIRLGWQWPALRPTLPMSHGPLMVAGFFGTLIALERAVALGKAWAYVGPIFNGLGGVLLAFGIPGVVAPIFITLGSVWLIVIVGVVFNKHRTGYLFVMALGAITLLIGNLLWLSGWQVYQFVLWWASFLILTIAGERLELGRMVKKPAYAQSLFFGITLIYLVGLVMMLFSWDLGIRIAGIGIAGLAFWLLGFDIARRTVWQSGLTRFIAICLLSGYVWLIAAGGIALVYGGYPAGPIYDAMLHSIFLGFVFSMIFGHAPIIFPAVLGVDIDYKPRLYLPLILLHISLILRIAGELSSLSWARLWGGLINVVAVMLYLAILAQNNKRTPNLSRTK